MGLEQHSQFIEQRLFGGVQDRVNLVRWRKGSSKILFPLGQFDDKPSSGAPCHEPVLLITRARSTMRSLVRAWEKDPEDG